MRRKPVRGQFRAGRWTSCGHKEPGFFYAFLPPSLAPVRRMMATEHPAVIARRAGKTGSAAACQLITEPSLLTSHWPKYSPIITCKCKGAWEMESVSRAHRLCKQIQDYCSGRGENGYWIGTHLLWHIFLPGSLCSFFFFFWDRKLPYGTCAGSLLWLLCWKWT